MSPQAGELLIEQIAPRLRATIPRVVKPVGAEDSEELVQDAITVAAQMLQRVEACGKQVTPGNIAYYVLLHMKSGRRSHVRPSDCFNLQRRICSWCPESRTSGTRSPA